MDRAGEKKIMRYGVIDIGSNTIRGVVYDINGSEFKSIFNEAEYAALLGYVRNGVLTVHGYKRLVMSLEHLINMMEPYNCEVIHAFATASLRDIEDKDELFKKISERLKISIRFITGEEEALYDYRSIAHTIPDSRNGIGLDLGGGSCQIFRYDDTRVVETGSLRIGSLRMYEEFVGGMLPIQSEVDEIMKFVETQLETLPMLKDAGFETIYGMGGTSRALAELLRILSGNRRVNHRIISVDDMEDIMEMSVVHLNRTARMIHQLMAKHLTTIIPGTAVLLQICRYTGAEHLRVLECGVREGFMATMLENGIHKSE